MDYTYSYLIGTIFPLIVWIYLYFSSKKESKKEIIIMSLIGGFTGIVMEFFHIQDWWHPVNITHTLVGFEDFIYGFAITGMCVSAYQVFLRRKFVKSLKKPKEHFVVFSIVMMSILITLSLLIGTIIASFITSLIAIVYLLYKRKDLIKYGIISGFFVTLLSLPSYFIVEYFTPGWIANTWYLENFSGIFLWRIPLEEIIWHFMIGVAISMIYKYIEGLKEVINKTNKPKSN